MHERYYPGGHSRHPHRIMGKQGAILLHRLSTTMSLSHSVSALERRSFRLTNLNEDRLSSRWSIHTLYDTNSATVLGKFWVQVIEWDFTNSIPNLVDGASLFLARCCNPLTSLRYTCRRASKDSSGIYYPCRISRARCRVCPFIYNAALIGHSSGTIRLPGHFWIGCRTRAWMLGNCRSFTVEDRDECTLRLTSLWLQIFSLTFDSRCNERDCSVSDHRRSYFPCYCLKHLSQLCAFSSCGYTIASSSRWNFQIYASNNIAYRRCKRDG